MSPTIKWGAGIQGGYNPLFASSPQQAQLLGEPVYILYASLSFSDITIGWRELHLSEVSFLEPESISLLSCSLCSAVLNCSKFNG